MFSFPKLIFPEFDAQISILDSRHVIFDPIRKKHVALTPEEWVRQHVIHFLWQHKGIPKGLIKLEASHKMSIGTKRSDILIVDRSGSVWMIVECKAYDVTLSEKTLLQAAGYAGQSKSRFLMLTNGLNLFLADLKDQAKQINFWPDFDAG